MRAALAVVCFSALRGADFSGAVISPDGVPARVLREELAKRTGVPLSIAGGKPSTGPAIVFERDAGLPLEAYRLRLDGNVLRIASADARGALYGVGHFLRRADGLRFELPVEIVEKPAYPIRGHQLGYRHHANSYDAWTIPQMDRYIRELAFFGANSIEAIPFQDERSSSLMKVSRRIYTPKLRRLVSPKRQRHTPQIFRVWCVLI